MSAEHRTHGKYFLPGRLRPLEERIPSTVFPSWDEVSGVLDITTRNKKDLHRLYVNHRQVLHGIYDGWFDVATKNDRTKLDAIIDRYSNPESASYNPTLLDELGPLSSRIRDKFPTLRSKNQPS